MNVYFCGETSTPIAYCNSHIHHNMWEIISNTSGDNVTTIGNKKFEIVKGSVMIIPPNTPHEAITETSYTDIYVQAKKLDFSETIVINDSDGNINALMKMLHKTMVEHEENYASIADAILSAICQIIKKYSKHEYTHKFIYELKNLIYQNISNPNFLLSDVENSINYNIDYIRRCFF